jgi:hypothetical protein
MNREEFIIKLIEESEGVFEKTDINVSDLNCI